MSSSRAYISELGDNGLQSPNWEVPRHFDVSNADDRSEVAALVASGAFRRNDTLGALADDLSLLRYPNEATDGTARAQYRQEVLDQGEEFGMWVAYPWLGRLVQVADQPDFHDLRTFRDRDLRTTEEQQELYYGVGIVVVGLSVGSIAVESLVTSGIGDDYTLADPARVTFPNLNRMWADVADVGSRKVDNAARRVSLKDPYIRQTLLPEGLNAKNMDVALERRPRVIIEAADNPLAKAQAREAARQAGVALIMPTDVGHVALVDVERYDTEKDVQPFGGRLSAEEFDALLGGQLTREQLGSYVIKIVGPENLSPRIIDSLGKIGTSLGGYPQLGATARTAGAATAEAVQRVVLGWDLPSGRYTPQELSTLNQAVV